MIIKNPKNLHAIHSWSYIAGLIETDGTFSLRLDKNGYFLATVAIPQKNTDLLASCQLFCQKHQLNALFDFPKKKTARAPSIRIRGPLQVLKLLNFLQKKANSYEKPFCSQKYRDFLVMIYTLKHRSTLNPEQKIDLLMSLHKVHQNQPDLLQYSSKKTRQQHEFDWGIKKKNQSCGAAYDILKKIDAVYQRHCKTDLSVLANMFKEDWYWGLIDGDGYFGL